MNNQNLVEKLKSTFRQNSTQLKVFNLLSDKEWHCLSCEGKNLASEQYEGGGGIQGLQRGTKSRLHFPRQKNEYFRWTRQFYKSNMDSQKK